MSACFAAVPPARGTRRAGGARSDTSGGGRRHAVARSMKVVHWTDVHFHKADLASGLAGSKELLGLANLYLMGRAGEYDSERLVEQLVKDVDVLRPDLVIFSGDLSALGRDEEFETAKRVLMPMLNRYPTVMIAGNHDRYTLRGKRRMDSYFGDWMLGGRVDGSQWRRKQGDDSSWPRIFRMENGLCIVTLDQARPSTASNGAHSKGQIARLRTLLRQEDPNKCLVVGHYPVYDVWEDGGLPRDGLLPLYDRFGRALKDVRDLHAALLAHTPVGYLCGHHHSQNISRYGDATLQVCCGNSAYVGPKPSNRAGFFEIELEVDAAKASVLDVRRHVWDTNREKFELDVARVPGNWRGPVTSKPSGRDR